MDDHARRDNLLDGIFDSFAGGVGLFKAGGSWDADGDIHEIALAGFSDADAFALQDAFGFVHCGFEAFAKAGRGHIEQRVRSAFTQARTDPDNHSRYGESRNSVELAKQRYGVTYAEPSAGNPRITTNVLQTSVEKWSASASRASLGYLRATRFSPRERKKSIPMQHNRIMIAV